MLLIVGLGNPGLKYATNRHNIGFVAIDAIARRHGFGPWRRKFQSEVAEGMLAGTKVLALKPQTYMNNSGRAVGEAARFFQVPPGNIVVLHDELDLPLGKVRPRPAAAMPGTMACARSRRISVRISIGCGSASAIPARNRWFTTMSSTTSARPRWHLPRSSLRLSRPRRT